MKTYYLKDTEALVKILKLCPSFSEKLQDACEHELDDDGVEVTIYIKREDVKIDEPYNPNGWNNYPAVTPPIDVVMRCENQNNYHTCRYAARFNGDEWRSAFGSGGVAYTPTRYRPWE